MSNARPPSRSDARMSTQARGPQPRPKLQTLNRLPKALIVIGLAASSWVDCCCRRESVRFCSCCWDCSLPWLIALSWPILPRRRARCEAVTVALVFGAAWLRLTGRG